MVPSFRHDGQSISSVRYEVNGFLEKPAAFACTVPNFIKNNGVEDDRHRS